MIVCPNCNHANPEGAQTCEACYTPLPATTSCPHCGAPVQADATFCGQCGSNLRPSTATEATVSTVHSGIPDNVSPEPGQHSPLVTSAQAPDQIKSPNPPDPASLPPTVVSVLNESVTSGAASSKPPAQQSPQPSLASTQTQLQQQTARLLHVQTNTVIELPPNLSVIHLGKPNDRIPPDVDVSGFPHSEVTSRIHADIRVEGDTYYIEDVGSSNGTYINNMPLLPGNRHRLRPGDRIALGKGDMVTFLFQLS